MEIERPEWRWKWTDVDSSIFLFVGSCTNHKTTPSTGMLMIRPTIRAGVEAIESVANPLNLSRQLCEQFRGSFFPSRTNLVGPVSTPASTKAATHHTKHNPKTAKRTIWPWLHEMMPGTSPPQNTCSTIVLHQSATSCLACPHTSWSYLFQPHLFLHATCWSFLSTTSTYSRHKLWWLKSLRSYLSRPKLWWPFPLSEFSLRSQYLPVPPQYYQSCLVPTRKNQYLIKSQWTRKIFYRISEKYPIGIPILLYWRTIVTKDTTSWTATYRHISTSAHILDLSWIITKLVQSRVPP